METPRTELKQGLKQRFEALRKNRWTPFLFFFGGFVFDVFTVERIDSPVQIAQIAGYTLVLTVLIYLQTLEAHGAWAPSERSMRFWKYREHAAQFVFGALLSMYTLFYFKSASVVTSILFLIAIGGLLVANEFVRLERHQAYLSLTLYFVCLASMWIVLVPTLLGFVGFLPFLLALAATGGWIAALLRSLRKRMSGESGAQVGKAFFRTGGGVVLFLLLSYYFQLIPPVPLAIQYMGIFHDLKKENGQYVLFYNRPWWKFWENGDQTFLARPGDKIVAFASVFSPRGFKDDLYVRWLLHTPRGWERQDLIPITVSGGRDQGFRGYTTKSNYQPGEYRVQVETTDGREIGRIRLTVVPDDSTEVRQYETLVR